MIKDFYINTANETVLATLIISGAEYKVFCDTGGDGGESFRNALVAYTNPQPGALYFNGTQIVSAGVQPSPNHIFDYAAKQWVDPRTNETEWEVVRAQRSQLLQQSDWTQLPDVPLATKEAWAIYRQALRDVTNQPDPFNIVWPVAPG